MRRTTIPLFIVDTGTHKIEIHPVDLKNIADSQLISPSFMAALAEHDKPFIRAIAAEHPNTPSEVLVKLSQDYMPTVFFAALENPCTPFDAVLQRWHKMMPEGTIWDSPAVVERHSDVLQFIHKYNITEEESRSIPARWIVAMVAEQHLAN